jgi:hypothetical protein
MEDVCLFYGNLVYFIANGYKYFMIIWYIFSRFGMLHQENLATLISMPTQKKNFCSRNFYIFSRTCMSASLTTFQIKNDFFMNWQKNCAAKNVNFEERRSKKT